MDSAAIIANTLIDKSYNIYSEVSYSDILENTYLLLINKLSYHEYEGYQVSKEFVAGLQSIIDEWDLKNLQPTLDKEELEGKDNNE